MTSPVESFIFKPSIFSTTSNFFFLNQRRRNHTQKSFTVYNIVFTLTVKCLNIELPFTHSYFFGHKNTSIPVCITYMHTRAHIHMLWHNFNKQSPSKLNKGLVSSSHLPATHQNLLLSNHGYYILITETILNVLFPTRRHTDYPLLVCRHDRFAALVPSVCHVLFL